MDPSLDPSLILVTIDWTTNVVTLHRDDGAVGTAQLPQDGGGLTRIKSTTWSPPLHAVAFETTDGDHLALELPHFDGVDHLGGRLVVYLDQNIWSRVSRAVNDPDSATSNAEARAALELAGLVEHRKVILPLSSGHFSETTAWSDNARRYQLGLTILRLSRGWQMRDPLVMRRLELRRALLQGICAEPAQRPLEPFTLQSNAATGRVDSVAVPSDFPLEAAHVMKSLTYLSAMVSTILDVDPIPATTKKIGWVESNQTFSDWLDGETKRPGQQKRRSVDVLLLNDLSTEIAEEAHRSGMRPEQMSSWVHGSMFRDMAGMPIVGIYRSILQERHLNVGTRWTVNDLTDMVYLSAAAGYADFVVAERHETAMLKQARRRLGRGASVHSSLAAALSEIQSTLGLSGDQPNLDGPCTVAPDDGRGR